MYQDTSVLTEQIINHSEQTKISMVTFFTEWTENVYLLK